MEFSGNTFWYDTIYIHIVILCNTYILICVSNHIDDIIGLKRNGKSCRLRWVNYLRPDLKRGRITPHEESIILDMHARWGNRYLLFILNFKTKC